MDPTLSPSLVTFEASNPTEYISFNGTTTSSAKLQILPASGQALADSFLFGIRQVTKSLNQEYIGCYVADTTATTPWFSTAGTAQAAISTTDCFNKATAAKARYFGLTKNNLCYYGDGTTYNSKGLQPAVQCMLDNTGKIGTLPNFGDNTSFAMYEVSYSRSNPVIDAVTIGSSVIHSCHFKASLTRVTDSNQPCRWRFGSNHGL